MRPTLRPLLFLQAAALAAASAALLLALGLPLAARGALGPRLFVALVAAQAALVFALALALLLRGVARHVDRILGAAERLGEGGTEMPLLGESGGPGLSRAAVAFERLAAALAEERARLAARVAELERTNRDLAEARQSLARSERLATVGRLAAGVAHEVGNPLGAISGYVDLARGAAARGGGEGALEDYLARIDAEARRIDRTVRALLDFARPGSPALVPIDLAAAVEAALAVARVQARFRGVAVELDLPTGLPRVLGDEHTLAQVLVNLFLNAGDALGGRGRVTVSARARGGRVEVRVEDEGPGIPEADLARVFDPFFTTKEPGQGTGLGLSICHRIMESYGGEISAANRPGGGAALALLFRAAPPPEAPAGRVLD